MNPLDAEDLRDRVQKVLDDYLTRQLRLLQDVATECTPMVESISDLMRGGKRLRPAFCYWGYRGAGGPGSDGVVTAAAALEFFQAAALVHDDVMDGSDTRRGMPAVHRRFEAAHRDAGWAGDPGRFGLAGAVLVGDLCLGWSDELFSAAALPLADLARARPVFERMRTELMAGQFLDMLEQARAVEGAGGPVERARRVIRFKSAKYSIEAPLLIGGALAGADPDVLHAYSALGLPLGEAFQLRDDVLGVFGDPAVTGKPAGDDLREGKRTVLLAKALEAASPAQAEVLERLVGDPALDDAGVATGREILVATGALDAVERLVDELVGTARAQVDAAPIAEEARAVLHALVEAATVRAC